MTSYQAEDTTPVWGKFDPDEEKRIQEVLANALPRDFQSSRAGPGGRKISTSPPMRRRSYTSMPASPTNSGVPSSARAVRLHA